jgi:hypothetical protein
MSSFNVNNDAEADAVTASGATCAEIPIDSAARDGLLIENRDASIDIHVTLLPDRDEAVYTTAQAYAKRIFRVAAGTTEMIGIKGLTRVLVSAASGTPAFAYQEYKS